MKGCRAFSLTEVLVVLLILVLLIALVFPVFTRAKEASKTVPCAVNLRQLYVAYSGYETDYDQAPAPTLGNLMLANVNLPQILKCPTDTTTGGNGSDTEKLHIKVSYFYMLPMPAFRAALAQADPNHGIAYCVLHGQRLERGLHDFEAKRDTTGLVLRLRADGSIQRAQVGDHCGPLIGSGRIDGRSDWYLLSDVHCVEPFCFGIPDPCGY